MNPKSHIKLFLFAHTLEAVSRYLGCSVATLHNWKKRGYAEPSSIDRLSEYPCSITKKSEFLDDIKVNKK